MVTKKKHDAAHLSILEAVEALESIADLEFEREVDVASEDEINQQNHMVTARAVKWLGKEDPDETANLIKNTFHVVLDYLRDYYMKESASIGKPQVVEGVKTIMVLIGEAAQKLDRYTTLFQQTKATSVRELDEYKKLQEFYLTRIARKIDEGILGKWILELTKGLVAKKEKAKELVTKKPMAARYVFIDLESVKKDSEYELFFLRKEDGTRFFNPKLIRNIKLVCDFGETISQRELQDTFSDVKVWQDHAMHIVAKDIVKAMGGSLDRYFHETKRSWKRELVGELNKALIALFMAANPKNLLRNGPVKTCSEYMIDFHFFLRVALHSREYQRFMVYPPKKSARLAHLIIEVTHNLCRALFTGISGFPELRCIFEKVYQEAKASVSEEHEKAVKESQMLWNGISSDHAAMKKLIKNHPNGPLVKILETLEQGSFRAFDPTSQGNVPSHQYSLYLKEHKMTNIRLPSPTFQEYINKAVVTDEFKGFLRAYAKGKLKKKHLLINLQDKTSWREHARCSVLEEVTSVAQFAKSLSVVTLAKDTEFYHQSPPYHEDHKAEVFFEHFKENLSDENCGFFFPQTLKRKLFPKFMNELMEEVHKVFFGKMNVLTVKNRQDFIEIFYLFLQLKLIELIQPDTFSFTCKDAIDIGGTANAQFFAFLEILQSNLSKKTVEHVNNLLYIAPLLIRERIVLSDRFERMVNTIKRIETTKEEMGEGTFNKEIHNVFTKLYKTPMLKTITVVPYL